MSFGSVQTAKLQFATGGAHHHGAIRERLWPATGLYSATQIAIANAQFQICHCHNQGVIRKCHCLPLARNSITCFPTGKKNSGASVATGELLFGNVPRNGQGVIRKRNLQQPIRNSELVWQPRMRHSGMALLTTNAQFVIVFNWSITGNRQGVILE